MDRNEILFTAVHAGKLGSSVRSKTKKWTEGKSSHRISVVTRDYRNKQDVRRVYDELLSLDLNIDLSKLRYLPEIDIALRVNEA